MAQVLKSMKVRVRTCGARTFSRVLRCVHLTALAGSLILLGWPLVVFLDSQLAQWTGARELERQLWAHAQTKSSGVAEDDSPDENIIPESAASAGRPGGPRAGSVIGRLEIPRLGMSYIVLEGTDGRTLDRSIGHIRSTALPGEAGNIGIAGHRNTHFKKLEWIRRDDEILLTAPNGIYRYRVEWVRLFDPASLYVLDPSHGPAITLVTCFPFEYVGSAPLRFVIRALPDDGTRARLEATRPTGDRS
jgi:sortase A